MSDDTQSRRIARDSESAADNDSRKRPCLIMIKGDFIGQVYELANDVTMLGRSDEVDLVISDITVSRRHAMIVNRVDGFHVSDLSSTNGTFVNREAVGAPKPLVDGDKLCIGMVTFRFSYQDQDDTQYHLMLRNMAIMDGLTRIYNRRYFLEALDKEFDYNRRNRSGLALILFDIDHFKRINDNHGHTAGDFILKQTSQLIEREARGYDVFARYGGEEFVLMMRGGTLDAAVSLAERVRSLIANQNFRFEEMDLKITISLGVVFWSGDESFTQPLALIDIADKQLYIAKNCGRNRVESTAVGCVSESER